MFPVHGTALSSPNLSFPPQHTAPQHRQYLSYEGIGMGTPSQRQKQYNSYQAMRAASNVNEYRVQKLSAEYPETALQQKERRAARKIRTRWGGEKEGGKVRAVSIKRKGKFNLSLHSLTDGESLAVYQQWPNFGFIVHQ